MSSNPCDARWATFKGHWGARGRTGCLQICWSETMCEHDILYYVAFIWAYINAVVLVVAATNLEITPFSSHLSIPLLTSVMGDLDPIPKPRIKFL